jgi:hypothetical protein
LNPNFLIAKNVITIDNNLWIPIRELKDKLNDLLRLYSDKEKEKLRKDDFDEWT